MSNMTKRKLYENIIDIQKKSGQGLSGIVGKMDSGIQDMLDELMEEGVIKMTTQHYSHLPDDNWYFPILGYCVFEDSDKSALSFVRMFLGRDTEIFLNFPYTDFIQNVDFMKRYSDWLTKNKEQLDIMINLDDEYKGNDVLFSDEEIVRIKSKEWFLNNKTIEECLNLSRSSISDIDESITLNGRLISLYQKKGDSEKEIQDCEKEIENKKEEKKFRKRLINYFTELNQKSYIQEEFNL